MFEAQLAITKTSAYSFYGPWFSSGGDDGNFEVEIVEMDGDFKVTVEVLTKTSGLSGDGGSAGLTLDSTSASAYVGNTTGGALKDLVRYKYTVSDEQSAAGSWGLFRMKPPRFYDTV